MKLEVARDEQGFRVGIIDPAPEAVITPLQIKFAAEGLRAFRIRLSKAPHSTDTPFLNGIRVLRQRAGSASRPIDKHLAT